MSNKSTNLKVILGVTGSISAYKAVDILRLFQKNGHSVRVIMTENAQKFIPTLTFETFTPGNVYTNMFAPNQDPVLHINLCSDSDLLLIAPATANIISKMANGIADDLLSTTFLAFYRTVVLAPAMNCYMLENPVTQENIARLRNRGIEIIEPESGTLACNYEGKGRLPDPRFIYDYCFKKVTGTIDV